MGDTVYFNKDGIAMPFDSLPEDTKALIRKYQFETPEQNQPVIKKDEPNYAPWVLLFLGVIGFVGVKRAWKAKGTVILGGPNSGTKIEYNEDSGNDTQTSLSDYFVYEGRDLIIPDEQYQKLLDKYLPYYRKLFPDLKDKFLNRTKKFLASKTFLIKSNQPFIEMPVLISATAVQLTFGMDDYLLPYFQYIRVYPEEYFAKDSLRVLAGHVYGNTITLAWNHFLKGHEEYTDGVNVGLHEMSHALYFQHVQADVIKSRSFISNFNEVMEEGQEVYELKKSHPCELFTTNAYRNLQEFWAESVELFFERPTELKRENAELYDSLKDILNQDPANSLYPVVA
jgi:Mlc titration factor MtfA (ptsG expression regulator)